MHTSCADLDEEQDVEATEGRDVDAREVRRDDAFRLGPDELGPRRSGPFGRRVDPGSPQHRPDRGCGDPVAEAAQFAVDAPVTPRRIHRGESDREPADLRERWWSAAWRYGRVGLVAGDQSAVPADHGLGPHDQHDVVQS